MKIFQGHVGNKLNGIDPYITLVQDKPSGKWLATQGFLYTRNKSTYLIEGHIVRVIGGFKDPFVLADQQLADTTVCIRHGHPEKISDTPTSIDVDTEKVTGTLLTGQIE